MKKILFSSYLFFASSAFSSSSDLTDLDISQTLHHSSYTVTVKEAETLKMLAIKTKALKKVPFDISPKTVNLNYTQEQISELIDLSVNSPITKVYKPIVNMFVLHSFVIQYQKAYRRNVIAYKKYGDLYKTDAHIKALRDRIVFTRKSIILFMKNFCDKDIDYIFENFNIAPTLDVQSHKLLGYKVLRPQRARKSLIFLLDNAGTIALWNGNLCVKKTPIIEPQPSILQAGIRRPRPEQDTDEPATKKTRF